MKAEVLKLKREMNGTSSQDEFAKWAKLRRRHDKSMEEYEAMSTRLLFLFPVSSIKRLFEMTSRLTHVLYLADSTISSQKSSFDWTVKIARWISTTGLKMFLQFWYSKTPVFALPEGWFPYYVEWILSFPRAPLGSVSIQVWSNVCGTAIAVVAEILGSLFVQAIGQNQGAMPAGDSEAKKAQ